MRREINMKKFFVFCVFIFLKYKDKKEDKNVVYYC